MSPSLWSIRNASRSGVRLTPSSSARATWAMVCPPARLPSRIASRIVRWTCSTLWRDGAIGSTLPAYMQMQDLLSSLWSMSDGPVVHAPAGAVQGLELAHGRAFLGIPYAQAERFAPPRPTSWQGELRADRPAPVAPQPRRPPPRFT